MWRLPHPCAWWFLFLSEDCTMLFIATWLKEECANHIESLSTIFPNTSCNKTNACFWYSVMLQTKPWIIPQFQKQYPGHCIPLFERLKKIRSRHKNHRMLRKTPPIGQITLIFVNKRWADLNQYYVSYATLFLGQSLFQSFFTGVSYPLSCLLHADSPRPVPLMRLRPSRSMDLSKASFSQCGESFVVIPGEAPAMIRFPEIYGG